MLKVVDAVAIRPICCRGHRERRQHQQRILIRLRERPHAMGRDRQPVGEEHGVEQPALGQRRSVHQALHADRIVGIVVVQPPAGFVIAVGRQEDDEVRVARHVATSGSSA